MSTPRTASTTDARKRLAENAAAATPVDAGTEALRLTDDERDVLRIKAHQIGMDSAILYVEHLIQRHVAEATTAAKAEGLAVAEYLLRQVVSYWGLYADADAIHADLRDVLRAITPTSDVTP